MICLSIWLMIGFVHDDWSMTWWLMADLQERSEWRSTVVSRLTQPWRLCKFHGQTGSQKGLDQCVWSNKLSGTSSHSKRQLPIPVPAATMPPMVVPGTGSCQLLMPMIIVIPITGISDTNYYSYSNIPPMPWLCCTTATGTTPYHHYTTLLPLWHFQPLWYHIHPYTIIDCHDIAPKYHA